MKPPPIPPPPEHVIKELCCLLRTPDGREISMPPQPPPPPPQPLDNSTESNAPRGYCADDEDGALNSIASRVIVRRAEDGSRRAAGSGMLPDRMAINVIAAQVTRAYLNYIENLRENRDAN